MNLRAGARPRVDNMPASEKSSFLTEILVLF